MVRLILLAAAFSIGLTFSTSPASAQSAAELEALREVERQLRTWEREGRNEDIKIIGANQDALMKQVKSGRIDLQAIVDDHKGVQSGNEGRPDGRDADAPAPPVHVSAPHPAADVPDANRPVAAYTYLEDQWSGFPAVLTKVARQAYVFRNGYAVYCANWDPRQFDPTPDSVGRAVRDCEVRKGIPNGKKTKQFRKGQTIDISFGNVSGDGYDLGAGSSSTISGSTLRMTREGHITIGKFNAYSVSSGGDGAGGGNRKRALRGSYTLDGHLITIATDTGESLVGFISWSSDGGGDAIDHVFINGEHFWDRRK